ncbi:MAG: hypothetical protein ABWY56_03085, partial [Propionibacteriaceae bacterium]
MARTGAYVSLLHTEALERVRVLDVTSTLVELDLTLGPVTFDSTTTTVFAASERVDTFVDFKGEQLRSATLDGVALEL